MIKTGKWFFVLLLLSGTALAVEDDIVKQADKLLKDGKAPAAYALLIPYQSDRAGDPDFDYRLGIAALDSGKPNEAIFALERVLAVKPDHLQARAEIARAYLATGETATSKQEFETVKGRNPPKEVNATVQKFLDAIEQATAGERTTKRAYLEATLGFDSNVNSATGTGQVAIPAFGGGIATLSASGVKQEDGFASVAGGFNVRHPVSPEWGLFAGGNFNQRINASKDVFDTQSLDANLGVNLNRGDDTYSAAFQMQTFNVDNNSFRDSTGLTLQWQRKLDNSSQVSAYFQYSELEYPGQNFRDANRYVAGAAFARALSGAYSPVVYVGGYAGEEKEKADNDPRFGHQLFGVRVGGEMKINPQTRLFGSASLESRNYGGTDPLFLVGRDDTQFDLRVGGSYVPAPSWTVTPQLSYTRNDSNIIINDYDRTALSVTLRRDFN
jgi:tetratricopeptide (TPR) repeat protein